MGGIIIQRMSRGRDDLRGELCVRGRDGWVKGRMVEED
jgi:hypothetical protein